tara:strand:- start:4543 stop:6237 length:1695 start_codon:yes stop_codon:yes gene_type:complete
MSYRNPVTYVDSQSGKYFASAIQNISNTTAGVIDTLGAKAEAERKKKEEENFKLLNDVTKYNLDYLNNANLASKDFDIQPALQPALSGLVDQGARIKAQLLNSKNPAERAQLQSQLAQYETFFKGGGMKNLLESFQEKRELFSKLGVTGKAGGEGGIDMKKLDPKLAKFFMSTYNDTLPSDLSINIVNNNGVFDIVLNSTGGQFGKEGGYQQSLMALMSADLPIIPGITSELNATLTEDKLIDKNGTAYINGGQAASYLTAGKVINLNGQSIQTYDFTDKNKALFRQNMEKNVLATLAGYSNQGSLMDGPGTGFNAIESYYNNVLREKGDDHELKIGSEQGTSLSPESLEIVKNKMLDKMEEKFKKSIPQQAFKKASKTTGGRGTEAERLAANQEKQLNNVANYLKEGNTVIDLYKNVIESPQQFDYVSDYDGGLLTPTEYINEIESFDLDYMKKIGILESNAREKDRKEFIESEKNKLADGKIKELVNFEITEDGVSSNFGKTLPEQKAMVKLLLEIPQFSKLKPSQINAVVKDIIKNRKKKDVTINTFDEGDFLVNYKDIKI